MKEILDSIRYNDDRIFPRKKLQELIDGKEEAIPHLLDIMEELRENPNAVLDAPTRFDHIYACYLLAQFRVKEFFPLWVDILRFPGRMPHDLFGDVITEDADRILASVYDGDIEVIKGLIEDAEVGEYVRSAAMRCLAVLVLNGELSREDVLDYFKTLMTTKLQTDNYYVNAAIVAASNALYPVEIYEEIEDLYKKGVVELGVINIDNVDQTLQESEEMHLKRQKQLTRALYIDDTVEELHRWASFEQPKRKIRKERQTAMPQLSMTTNPAKKVEKIGRNDPCPCGSGKKYKKCCG
ncbi:DUF1186 domain-containing protein [Salicibibacter cibarius]|uniref:DUF1186 domain-containing protein n=1 Tax=Salicibibacter cibarius TaxID=2743000 RepID=A0A7T6Z5K2_9BACI|nr:DUF1186 domain-containing protein [Salicibibacter cibarius]QQK77311.1 DUF1186 domain-containing protein [Salicibibacter cibarius]